MKITKTGTQLINMLIETRAKGGNLLINVGPDPSGVIPFEQERVFRELGLWMFINREGIYDIRPCPVIGEQDGIWYAQSKDGKSVYVFLTQFTGENRWERKKRKEIVLTKLRGDVGNRNFRAQSKRLGGRVQSGRRSQIKVRANRSGA